MALDHAILVSLAERPGTGYELGRQFGRTIGHFWNASHQQIYRTLARLDERGLVDCAAVPQEGKPDKKVYSLSAAGRAELREWVSSPTPLQSLRDDLGVKIRAAEHADLPELITEIERHRELHIARLELYRSFESEQFPDAEGLTGRALHQHLVLRGGLGIEEFFVSWCTEVIDGLRRELAGTGTETTGEQEPTEDQPPPE